VYGEELRQTTAMWWSPDGTKLVHYRFDESKVPDYFLQLDQTKIQSTVDTEAYPPARRIRSSTCSCTTPPRRSR
jgi:dipeptidyl-peptidase-4